MLKKQFLTGLAILLPIAITLFILNFVINILTKPFVGFIEGILGYYGLLNKPFLFFSSTQVLQFTSKLLILVFLFGFIIAVGKFGQHYIVIYTVRFGDYLMHRIPLVNKIYKVTQDVVNTLLSSKGKSFKQVVLVPFPHPKSYSIGLVANEGLPENSDEKQKNKVSIFVPGTPNPTFGFMLLFNKDQLIYLDMKVEDALKLLVSCGVMIPEFSAVQPSTGKQDVSPK